MSKVLTWFVSAISSLAMLFSGGGSSPRAGSDPARGETGPFPYYDIRLDEEKPASLARAEFRASAGKTARRVGQARSAMAQAEEALRARVPALKVEWSGDLNAPEMIGIDVVQRAFLTGPAAGSRADALRGFLSENAGLVGLSPAQVADLQLDAEYTNPDGQMSYARLVQVINGLPVFRGEAQAGFTAKGEMVRIINDLAPGLDYARLAKDAGDPVAALSAAMRHLGREASAEDLVLTKQEGGKLSFARGQFADEVTAEALYFPIEPGVARLAWRFLLVEEVAGYYVIVDAETGTLLWRKNLTNDQSQPATYHVYNDDSPAPSSPTTALPGANFQAPLINRTAMTLIGNEPPNTFNNLGWMTDGTNGVNGHTDGNNAEAGLDLGAPDGVDAPVPGVGRVFNFAYNPGPGNPGPGDDPTLPSYRDGMVTTMFYWGNVYHDRLYRLGFTEPARNFQNDNFGRGGAAADRLRLEGQDSSGTNNANMLTPADGARGRAQMYRFTGPTPDRDGGIDMDVLLHELTHGTSNRLIGNGSGLGNNRGGSMGEGWSDFFARALLSDASEPLNGVYTTGGWVTYQLGGTFTDNYYYGIRRFPYAILSATGGPSILPYNPQTFADIDPAQINNADGAYPRNPLFGNSATEVHNAGEIWCAALLEVRARLITRLGFAVGNERMLQLVVDGMKLTPLSPTFTQARDAILAAALALGGSDSGDVWAGFASRGMGFGASDSNANTAVVESFALPNLQQTPTFTFSDAPGNGNSFPEPGEALVLTVPVQNPLSDPATGVTVSVNGGPAVSFGTIAGGQTVTRSIPYAVPAGQACGGDLALVFAISSNLGPTSANRTLRVGVPNVTNYGPFSNTGLITINDSAPATPYPSSVAVSGAVAPYTRIAVGINGLTHTFPGDLDFLLVPPTGQSFIVLSDGGGGGDVSGINLVLADDAAGPPSTSQLTSGTFLPYNSGANDPFAGPAPAGPYANPAPGGTDTLVGRFGATDVNGSWGLYVVDDANVDSGSISGGWSLTFSRTVYTCDPLDIIFKDGMQTP